MLIYQSIYLLGTRHLSFGHTALCGAVVARETDIVMKAASYVKVVMTLRALQQKGAQGPERDRSIDKYTEN